MELTGRAGKAPGRRPKACQNCRSLKVSYAYQLGTPCLMPDVWNRCAAPERGRLAPAVHDFIAHAPGQPMRSAAHPLYP